MILCSARKASAATLPMAAKTRRQFSPSPTSAARGTPSTMAAVGPMKTIETACVARERSTITAAAAVPRP